MYALFTLFLNFSRFFIHLFIHSRFSYLTYRIVININIVIFVIIARYSYIPFGIVWGSLIALAVCYINAYFTYTYILKKHA